MRCAYVAALVVAFQVVACEGQLAGSPSAADAAVDSAPDATDTGDAAPPGVATDPTSDASLEVGADAGADADAQCVHEPVPGDMPSEASIAFVLTNGNASDRWVATSAEYCEEPSIPNLLLNKSYWQTQCEGVFPVEQLMLQRVPAGQSFTYTWDARAVSQFETHVDCSWAYGSSCQPMGVGVWQAVQPGTYSITFAVTNSLPCSSWSSTSEQCQGGAVGFPGQACGLQGASLTNVTQSFSVPPSGTSTVTVALP